MILILLCILCTIITSMSLLRVVWLFFVITVSWVRGDFTMPASRYDAYQTELSVHPVQDCLTPVRNNGRLVQFRCTNAVTKQVRTLNVKKEPSGFYTDVENNKEYLLFDNPDGTIVSMRTVQVADERGNTFYVLDDANNHALCVASLNAEGKLQLTPVTRQLMQYEPPPVKLSLQEHTLLLQTCTAPLPEVLTATTVKTIAISEKGGLLLHCAFPESQAIFVYNIFEDEVTGLFTIEESGKAFLIETQDGGHPIAVRNMVRSTFMEDKPLIYIADDKAVLCTAQYNEILQDVVLAPVDTDPWSITPRTISVTSQEYDFYTTACTETLPAQFGNSTHKTITTDINGKLVLKCVSPDTHQVFLNELFWALDNKVLVFEKYGLLFLVLAGTQTNDVEVSIAVRAVHGEEEVVVLALDKNECLCMAWYNSQGVVQLIPVVKRSGDTGLKPRSLAMAPQEYLAYDSLLDGETPLQLTGIAAKKVTSDAKGKIQVTCTHPNTQQEFPYDLKYMELLGVYCIEDAGTKYLVTDLYNHINIRKVVLYAVGQQTIMLTNNDAGRLCTAVYDGNLDAVKLTDVDRQMMDCTNNPVTLEEKDYNYRFNICNKQLAEQFADYTRKLMITDNLGHLVLLSKYKRVEYKYPVDVDYTTGLLGFLYKDKQYLVVITREGVYVKIVFIGKYEDQTAVFTVNEAKQLCVASYDCANNIIFSPVIKKTKKT